MDKVKWPIMNDPKGKILIENMDGRGKGSSAVVDLTIESDGEDLT